MAVRDMSPDGSDAAVEPAARLAIVMGVEWSVREGRFGQFDAPELMNGYRAESAVREPKLGDALVLPDGSWPWRVADWSMGDRLNSPGNVLVVELFGD